MSFPADDGCQLIIQGKTQPLESRGAPEPERGAPGPQPGPALGPGPAAVSPAARASGGDAAALPGCSRPDTRTRASARNSLFLRIFLKISVSSSPASSSPSLGPAGASAAASAPASAPAAPGEARPGRGRSMVGSSACSISHSMAWGTNMLKGKDRHLPAPPAVTEALLSPSHPQAEPLQLEWPL